MKRPGGKVAILGGGMAGLSTAWRLSEPGWRARFDSITVYQRGWRLGGKGASSRGTHGRIEEHGLHVWLGSYENAFALLRECYAEINRATTDPDCPIKSWNEALRPAGNPGLAEESTDGWVTWLGSHPHFAQLPGDPDSDGRELTVISFLERAARLLQAFTDSLQEAPTGGLVLSTSALPPQTPDAHTVVLLQHAIAAALLSLTRAGLANGVPTAALEHLQYVLDATIDSAQGPGLRRRLVLLSLLVAVVRGILADNLVTHPYGFRGINDRDFCDWIQRHGAHPDVVTSAMVRGLYDLVFGYDRADPGRPAVSAGLMVFLVGQVLFGYKGALFWKMAAGMGDIVIAPLYQALRRRGVRFEFFHRVDALHPDESDCMIEAITVARQVRLAGDADEYHPLVKVKGLPAFPSAPTASQLATPAEAVPRGEDLESHFGATHDAEVRILRRGIDFDHVVLAVSLGIIPTVAAELLARRRDWRDMCANVRTLATQAFQIWLRPTESALGWHSPDATISAYRRPFETWASMTQTLWAEDWPQTDAPQSVAYFCGGLDAPWPPDEPEHAYVQRYRDRVEADAVAHVRDNVKLFYPKAYSGKGFDWKTLSGVGVETGAGALETQYVSVNIDPSDRYVQSVPNSDQFRLRPDESGYDNLVLAGDWTDCGINAGCIEAAVVSGLEAANVVIGHSRFHRVKGYWLP